MKLHRIALFAVLLGGTIASSAVHALDVTLYLVTTDTSGNTTSSTPLTPSLISGGAAVNLDADSPVGGAKTYSANGVPQFTIARCQGCAGRARVFVSEGSIDRLVLTDAQITNVSGAVATLRIDARSGSLTVSGPGGDYPYATELGGTFTAPLGAGAATDPANRIQVTALAEGNCEGPCMIDNPSIDAGEDSTTYYKYSLVAPPFLAGGLAQFAPKEQQILFCANFFPDTGGDVSPLCQPSLQLSVDISLKARHGARIPGSIGAFHVPERCEPDNGLLRGCETMANFFASLGPKGFKIYDVRLEASPGEQRTVDFRDGTRNSPDAWVTRRGERDDDDDDHGEKGNVSNTRVKLATNGSGDVKASGLCPAAGCPDSSILPVRVYCGPNLTSTTAIRLNRKGDGRADVSFSLPCPDPAVLIMDQYDDRWVAAPAIF